MPQKTSSRSDKGKMQGGDPPVVIAAPQNQPVRVVSSQFQQPASSQPASSYPMSTTPGGGHPRLVPIQSEMNSSSKPNAPKNNSQQNQLRQNQFQHSSQHQQQSSNSPAIPIVKISPANVNPQEQQQFNKQKEQQKQQSGNRMPWAPLVQHTSSSFTSSHPRPVVPVGSNGAAVMPESDLSGQHGVASRPAPGILRKRTIGEGQTGANPCQTQVSPRRLARVPMAQQQSVISSSNTSSAPQWQAPSHNLQRENSGPNLNRDVSMSSIKSEASDSMPNLQEAQPARKKPRKQQLLPRSAPDNLMANFEPLTTISQMPSGGQSGWKGKHSGGGTSSASSNSGNVKDEEERPITPADMTEDDRGLLKLATGEIPEFVDSEGVRWLSTRESSGGSKSKNNFIQSRSNQLPVPNLLASFKCHWRCRNNHFEKYTDVRAKGKSH